MTHKDEPVTAGEKMPVRSFMEKAIFCTGELRLRPIDIAFEKFIGSRKRIDDMDTFSAGWNAICFELEAEHTAALTALRERLEKEAGEAKSVLIDAQHSLRYPEEKAWAKASIEAIEKLLAKFRAAAGKGEK